MASYQLYMLCNGTSSREISDAVQEVNRLISGCIKKKEWDVDYSTLLGSRLPLPTDYEHLLESITSPNTKSMMSVMLLSEYSENTINTQKRISLFSSIHCVGQSDTLIDLSFQLLNCNLIINPSLKLHDPHSTKSTGNIFELVNHQFNIDLSESFNVVDGVDFGKERLMRRSKT